jgi:hypothetical protein
MWTPHTTRQAGNVCITQRPGVFLQKLLQWKSNKHYTRTEKAEASNHASITFSKYAFVALGTQREMLIHHIAIYDLSSSTIFFSHYLINGTILEKKLLKIKCVF